MTIGTPLLERLMTIGTPLPSPPKTPISRDNIDNERSPDMTLRDTAKILERMRV
uniref:Uncharacterized protein n=1 Tax=Parascaris univalens TaxID=6257 RepID=A0A915B5G5_PARUN